MPDSPNSLLRFTCKRPACLDTKWMPGTGLIWRAGECVFYDRPVNRFLRFRRAFNLDASPHSATLRIFADTYYLLYVNGEYVGRGPGRSDPRCTRYDVRDITPWLHTGRNVVAVLCLFHGFGSGARISIMPGLLFHLEAETSTGTRHTVVSDRSWKASPAPEFVRPTPRQHATLGCYEIWNGEAAETRWMQPDYDDTAWDASDYMKASLSNTPWYHWVARETPLLQETTLAADRVCLVGEADYATPEAEHIGDQRPFPASTPLRDRTFPFVVENSVAPDQSLTHAKIVTIDMGRVENGLFFLDVTGPAGAVIDVLYAEFLVDGVVPRPPQARMLGDRFILPGGRVPLQVAFNWKAFRYAQLWIWSPEQVILHDAGMRTLYYPLPDVVGFTCDDHFLNQLDNICDHTMRLCMQDAYVDSSSREQQQWIGDGRRQAIINHYRWGDTALHRQLIEQIGQGQDWRGSLSPRHPAGNVNVSPIPAYCLDWIVAFDEYYWFTGDDSLLLEWWPNIIHALRWFTAFENDHGLLERVPHWMYLDVGGYGKRPGSGAINTALNLKLLEAMRIAARMAKRVDDTEACEWYQAKSEQLETAIRTFLWDTERSVYPDAYSNGVFTRQHSELTAALALLHLESHGSWRADSILRQTFLSPDADVVPGSPLAMLEILEALVRHCHPETGLYLLRQRYAEQVANGAGSTWEHWQALSNGPDGYPLCHSASHAWGAAPIAFFANTILGIRPLEPGWGRVLIKPHLAGLRQAAGAIQTPRGRISVAWEVSSGGLRLKVDVPTGLHGVVQLPGEDEMPLASGEYNR